MEICVQEAGQETARQSRLEVSGTWSRVKTQKRKSFRFRGAAMGFDYKLDAENKERKKSNMAHQSLGNLDELGGTQGNWAVSECLGQTKSAYHFV